MLKDMIEKKILRPGGEVSFGGGEPTVAPEFEGLIDSRKISKLFSYLIEILTRLGNEQSGGMAFANFDNEMADMLYKLEIKLTDSTKELI